MTKKLRVLLIVEQCNPEWASVPLVGFRFFDEISKLVEVTLVTHERNQKAIEKLKLPIEIAYMPESALSKKYYKLISKLVYKAKAIWPLYHTLTYPLYEEFNNSVYQQFKDRILSGEFDLIHALTPMMPRYPYKVIKACQNTPFVLGPVNGGVPFPDGFKETAKKEFANLNFLRAVGRAVIPGYAETYQKANRVLAGSTYTLNLVQEMFNLPKEKLSLFYENGILSSLVESAQPKSPKTEDQPINLLFAGRLVPYKCADLVIDAIAQLEASVRQRVKLTIVGDGSERENLERQVRSLDLNTQVHFAGWVNQEDIFSYYHEADIFCFPSVREFGGAVVLEAMACGLPCIVVNHGGIGEYVTEGTGFKIDPISRAFVLQALTDKIRLLVENDKLRGDMSVNAIARIREFTWEQKAKQIVQLYREVLTKQQFIEFPPFDEEIVIENTEVVNSSEAL